jgi:hypothetical protein
MPVAAARGVARLALADPENAPLVSYIPRPLVPMTHRQTHRKPPPFPASGWVGPRRAASARSRLSFLAALMSADIVGITRQSPVSAPVPVPVPVTRGPGASVARGLGRQHLRELSRLPTSAGIDRSSSPIAPTSRLGLTQYEAAWLAGSKSGSRITPAEHAVLHARHWQQLK